MRKLALAIAAAATLLIGTIAPASAHWRGHHHHHWGGPGIGPAIALGLFTGALAAAAAPPVYYAPVYGPPRYYYGPRYYRTVRYYPAAYPYWYPW
ncbi:hypothetical protein EOW77_0001550 [Bradyrhizobium yuanmingense]|uniref:hypothetical protein n=1 Tax=Bradyrhizobium yuanmingense TaxID=108015 RepID=UPI000FE358E9|nr:hypothetical protein [Bradyrhizobium yuanmingense]TGN90554.1 hypothetical protein EOW77_0001550 [Bradyrhizobium yuanmingense]